MQSIKKRILLAGGGIGLLMGFFFLHPFSMLFQGMIHPTFNLNITFLKDAFNLHHLSMAFFFGLLGAVMGCTIVFFMNALSREKEKVKILEGLLPICAWCKKIRDDEGKESGTGDWVEIEQYIHQRSNADFTHGVCQECCTKVLKDIEQKK